jgi:Holliday junction DNA helicase RuvA
MIAYLRGKPIHCEDNVAIIDVHGVGYEVFAPTSVIQEWKPAEEVSVHVSTVVREDAFLLYGFRNAKQKDYFEILRSVNKIGPKLALTILSHVTVNELANAINQKNAVLLGNIPGIGKKTAERLCLELQNKLVPDIQIPLSAISTAPVKKQDPLQLALAQLDYRKTEIDMVLASGDVPGMDEADVQTRLRAALRYLGQQK